MFSLHSPVHPFLSKFSYPHFAAKAVSREPPKRKRAPLNDTMILFPFDIILEYQSNARFALIFSALTLISLIASISPPSHCLA